MTAETNGLTGFAVPDVPLPVPTRMPDAEAMDCMVHILAAMLLGHFPERIRLGYLDGNWPEDVADLLLDPLERQELAAHACLLLCAAEQG